MPLARPVRYAPGPSALAVRLPECPARTITTRSSRRSSSSPETVGGGLRTLLPPVPLAILHLATIRTEPAASRAVARGARCLPAPQHEVRSYGAWRGSP